MFSISIIKYNISTLTLHPERSHERRITSIKYFTSSWVLFETVLGVIFYGTDFLWTGILILVLYSTLFMFLHYNKLSTRRMLFLNANCTSLFIFIESYKNIAKLGIIFF